MSTEPTKADAPRMSLRLDFANSAGHLYLRTEGYDGIEAALQFVLTKIDEAKRDRP